MDIWKKFFTKTVVRGWNGDVVGSPFLGGFNVALGNVVQCRE